MAADRTAGTRWIRAAGVVGAYLVSVAVLFILQVGDGVRVPLPFAMAAPPLVYAALSMLVLRDASPLRRVSWIGGACMVHLLLGLLASIELTVAGGLPALSAFAQVFVLFVPAPVLTLLATPFVLAPFVDLLTAPAASSRPDVAPARSAPPPSAPSPVSAASSGSAASRPKPFTRAAGVGARAQGASPASATTSPAKAGATPAMTPPPRTAPTPAPVAAAPTMKPFAVQPTPVAVPSSAPTPPTVPMAAPAPAAAVAPMPPPAPVAKTPPRASTAARADEVMIRISFERVASQLPSEAFVLPFDRLAESLKEPHTLLVPRRLVLAQMRDGAVLVDWPTISSQFPELALGISDHEFRSRYPDLRLTLPADEILEQLPADARPLASAVLAAEPPGPLAAAVTPSNGHAPVPAAPIVPTPAAPPTVVAERATAEQLPASSPMIPVMAVAPTLAAIPVGASPPVAEEPASPLVDRDTLATIIDAFAHIGTFEAAAERVDATTLVALVAPGLPREKVTACAAHATRFLSGVPGEVMTVRTELAAVVVAAAPTPIVVAAQSPGVPIAVLELRAARAAAALAAGVATREPWTPNGGLQPLGVDARASSAARALTSFGAVEPSVFSAGAARVYVFGPPGHEAAALGSLATSLCEALRDPGKKLGPLVSVEFWRGSERMVVRPLGDGTAMLVVGTPSRPGRAHRDAARAASVLEGS